MFKRIRLIMALVFLGLCSGSLMAQTVSGSYMISSTNEFGTHYLAFDGTSLADATTFNPATCMWDVAITNGTCTVSMNGNYLTMSGSTVAIGTPATTFTISDGKLMAGGNYLVFDFQIIDFLLIVHGKHIGAQFVVARQIPNASGKVKGCFVDDFNIFAISLYMISQIIAIIRNHIRSAFGR